MVGSVIIDYKARNPEGIARGEGLYNNARAYSYHATSDNPDWSIS